MDLETTNLGCILLILTLAAVMQGQAKKYYLIPIKCFSALGCSQGLQKLNREKVEIFPI